MTNAFLRSCFKCFWGTLERHEGLHGNSTFIFFVFQPYPAVLKAYPWLWLRDHSWWCKEDLKGCQGLNPGQPCARQVPSILHQPTTHIFEEPLCKFLSRRVKILLLLTIFTTAVHNLSERHKQNLRGTAATLCPLIVFVHSCYPTLLACPYQTVLLSSHQPL